MFTFSMNTEMNTDSVLQFPEGNESPTMKCQLFCYDHTRPPFSTCGEQATMLWIASDHDAPIPCCAYHAQDCPNGQVVSLAFPEAAHRVTFLTYEAHA